MTARFRSAFFGASGYVAARPVARVTEVARGARSVERGPNAGQAPAKRPARTGRASNRVSQTNAA